MQLLKARNTTSGANRIYRKASLLRFKTILKPLILIFMQSEQSTPYQPFDWEAYNAQKKIEDEKYAKLKIEIEETQRQSKLTLESLDSTFKNLNEAIQSAQQTQKNIENFQTQFNDVFKALGEKLATALTMEASFKAPSDDKRTAQVVDIKTARECLRAAQKRIMILSGAGLSYASGIPTFRGEGGFWKQGADTYKCQEVLTKRFLEQDPEKCWEWHRQFQALVKGKAPNQGHKAVAEYYQKQRGRVVLVTQNIDNLLTQCLPKEYISQGMHKHVIEIHGNINYMRCENNCSDTEEKAQLFEMPDLKTSPTPSCPKCKGKVRPHILFFDESYNDKFYRRSSVQEQFDNCDLLIVVGTTLETGLSAGLVRSAIRQQIKILEINPEPVIEVGNTLTLTGKSEEILPQLFEPKS